MRIDVYCTELKKQDEGIIKLIILASPKGRVYVDLKKKVVIIQDFSKEKLEKILEIIRNHFNYTKLELNGEKQFKIPNEEKIIEQKKGEMVEEVKKNQKTLNSKVKKFILEEKVFTLVDLKKTFPNNNEASLRSCVNLLKKEGVLHEIRPGKYCLL